MRPPRGTATRLDVTSGWWADRLLVYCGTPDGESGYSIIDFPCSAPGEIARVEVVMESDDGESRASTSGTVECPTKWGDRQCPCLLLL